MDCIWTVRGHLKTHNVICLYGVHIAWWWWLCVSMVVSQTITINFGLGSPPSISVVKHSFSVQKQGGSLQVNQVILPTGFGHSS